MCGPATMPITRASILKCARVSISCAATFSWPAVSGRDASSEERTSLAGAGSPPTKRGRRRPDEVGRVGDVAAVAPLRREIGGIDRLGRTALHAFLVLDRVLGEA